MKDHKSLIQHPFIINFIEESGICATERGFSLQFGNDVLGKCVNSFKEKTGKRFIIIETEGDTCRILHEANEIHRFRAPADFYIPIDSSSKEFYEDFYDHIVSDGPEGLSTYSAKVTEYLKEHGFPPITMPKISTAQHFTRLAVQPDKKSTTDRILCKKAYFGESVPTEADPCIIQMLKKRIGSEEFAVQDKFLNELFRIRKVWRYTSVLEEYESRLTEEEKNILKKWHLKNCLAVHAYFCLNGPWRCQWIVFGLDPARDATNYRYQLFAFERNRPTFQLCDLPSVIKEVDAHPDRYLRRECDPVYGFISEALKNFVLLTLDTKKHL